MNKKLKILISIILVVVLIAGGYVGNMFGVFNRGNYGEYSLKNTHSDGENAKNDAQGGV